MTRLTRRAFLAGGLAAAAGRARAAPRPIVLGLTCDATGPFAASGQADRRGMILAIEEANARGGVLGRPLEYRDADTAGDPAAAAVAARALIEREHADVLAGAIANRVAATLGALAQRTGVVYMNSNASAEALGNEQCRRAAFTWDATTGMFARALGPLVTRAFGSRWLFVTQDAAWGRAAAAAARTALREEGGDAMGEILVADGARDFSGVLLGVRSRRPDVVVASVTGAEAARLREQAFLFGAERDARWVFPPIDYPDLLALGPRRGFGHFLVTWHAGAGGAAEFVARFHARWAGAAIEVPCNVSVNGYLAVREALRAMERAGTTDAPAVVAALEGHVVRDALRAHPLRVRAWDHLVEQPLALVRTKRPDAMVDRYDLLETVAEIEPARIAPPREASACRLPPPDSPRRGS